MHTCLLSTWSKCIHAYRVHDRNAYVLIECMIEMHTCWLSTWSKCLHTYETSLFVVCAANMHTCTVSVCVEAWEHHHSYKYLNQIGTMHVLSQAMCPPHVHNPYVVAQKLCYILVANKPYSCMNVCMYVYSQQRVALHAHTHTHLHICAQISAPNLDSVGVGDLFPALSRSESQSRFDQRLVHSSAVGLQACVC